MSTWEWFGALLFGLTTILLFFAAFGGSNFTEQSVYEYIKRLLGENNEGEQK